MKRTWNVQTFTQDGVWQKPANANGDVLVIAVGGSTSGPGIVVVAAEVGERPGPVRLVYVLNGPAAGGGSGSSVAGSRSERRPGTG